MEIILLSLFFKVTLTGTEEHEINFDDALLSVENSRYGTATIELVSGSLVQVSPYVAIDSNSGTVTTDNPKAIVGVKRGIPLRLKGSGGEVLTVSIIPD